MTFSCDGFRCSKPFGCSKLRRQPAFDDAIYAQETAEVHYFVFLGQRVNLKQMVRSAKIPFVHSFFEIARENDCPQATAYRQAMRTRDTPIVGEPLSRVLRICNR